MSKFERIIIRFVITLETIIILLFTYFIFSKYLSSDINLFSASIGIVIITLGIFNTKRGYEIIKEELESLNLKTANRGSKKYGN